MNTSSSWASTINVPSTSKASASSRTRAHMQSPSDRDHTASSSARTSTRPRSSSPARTLSSTTSGHGTIFNFTFTEEQVYSYLRLWVFQDLGGCQDDDDSRHGVLHNIACQILEDEDVRRRLFGQAGNAEAAKMIWSFLQTSYEEWRKRRARGVKPSPARTTDFRQRSSVSPFPVVRSTRTSRPPSDSFNAAKYKNHIQDWVSDRLKGWDGTRTQLEGIVEDMLDHLAPSNADSAVIDKICGVLTELANEVLDKRAARAKMPSLALSKPSPPASTALLSVRQSRTKTASKTRATNPFQPMQRSSQIRASSAPPILTRQRDASQTRSWAVPEPGFERYKDFSRDWLFRQFRLHEERHESLYLADIETSILRLLCKQFHHLSKKDVARIFLELHGEYERIYQAELGKVQLDVGLQDWVTQQIKANTRFSALKQTLLADKSRNISPRMAEDYLKYIYARYFASPSGADPFNKVTLSAGLKPVPNAGKQARRALGRTRGPSSKAQLLVSSVQRRGQPLWQKIGWSLRSRLRLW